MPDPKSSVALLSPLQAQCSAKPIFPSVILDSHDPLTEGAIAVPSGNKKRIRTFRNEGERKAWLKRRKKYDENYRNRHRGKVREAQRRYLDKHPDKRKETCHNRYLKVRDKHLVWSKANYVANKETIIARQSRKQKENREMNRGCLPFARMLRGPMPRNIQAGAIALGVRKYRGAFEALRLHLLDPHPYVAEEIIWAFGEQREGRAVNDLILFAETTTDRFLLSGTIIALRKIGTAEALAAARSFSSHEDPRVRFSVIKSLKAVYPIDIDNHSENGQRKIFSDVVGNWEKSAAHGLDGSISSKFHVDDNRNGIGIESIIPDAPADWIAKVRETKERMDARRRGFMEEVKKGRVLTSNMIAGLERPHQEGYMDAIISGKILTMEVLSKIKKQMNSLE